MANNTVSQRRGSVRGPPPTVYIPFGDYVPDAEEAEALKPAIEFFGNLLKWAAIYILLAFLFIAIAVCFNPDGDFSDI